MKLNQEALDKPPLRSPPKKKRKTVAKDQADAAEGVSAPAPKGDQSQTFFTLILIEDTEKVEREAYRTPGPHE